MAKTLDELELRTLIDPNATPPRAAVAFTDNARYLTSLDGFNIKRPAVPAHSFRAERDRALAPGTPTGLVPLDLSHTLGLGYPATTPFILSRYARIRAGETLDTAFRASTELYHVIRGSGTTRIGNGETLHWEAADTFCLARGETLRHAAAEDAVLWVKHQRAPAPVRGPPAAGAGRGPDPARPLPDGRDPAAAPVRLPGSRGAAMAGKSVNLGNVAMESSRTTTPSFTLALNSLLPGESQRGHRHNAVAVTLVLASERCYSLIDGERAEWEPNTVMITPPAAFHSHHNEGTELALFLIVQDGGVYYHCRTMGFSYE